MQIGIVGAGIGGLGAALALARSGHQVHLIEQATAIEEVGAGIQMGPNGCRILDHWGLLTELQSHALAARLGWLGDALTGRQLCSFPLSRFAERHYRLPHLHVHRADLVAQLLRACRAEANIAIKLNCQVVRLQQSGRNVTLYCQNGEEQSFDLVVGADGARSTVARLGLLRPPARYSGRAAWRGLVDLRFVHSDWDLSTPAIWMAPGKHLVHYPIRDGRLLNLVACANHAEPEAPGWNTPYPAADFRSLFSGLAGRLHPLFQALEQSYIWGLYESNGHGSWVRGRVVLLGDAAHTMLPSMAQGAVMALEDAVILDAALSSSRNDPEEALTRYERVRRPRVQAVQRLAERNMQGFHLDRKATRAARLFALRLLGEHGDAIIGQRYRWVYGYDAFSALR